MAVSVIESKSGAVIQIFKESEDPVLTAAEIAERIGMTRQGANYRLKQLQEQDVVDRKKIGSRAVAWWLVED
ncbi:winged helix-turn-helix domain-containing protein [Halobellus inordinatus]|jgi:predicted ArsR family transcriptional regulator|uniref:winged helix-turn-helix domain-containing protein n=1 Tax=Halobellus inordinatus TaxID=1126236 RepID=UPI002113AF6F|nr:winged helix-turn-helix domain-containing protein [Halobellus ramosii]